METFLRGLEPILQGGSENIAWGWENMGQGWEVMHTQRLKRHMCGVHGSLALPPFFSIEEKHGTLLNLQTKISHPKTY